MPCLLKYVGQAPVMGPGFTLEHLEYRDIFRRDRVAFDRLQPHCHEAAVTGIDDRRGRKRSKVGHDPSYRKVGRKMLLNPNHGYRLALNFASDRISSSSNGRRNRYIG